MQDPHRELESSLHDLTHWIGQTGKVLALSGRPAPQSYLAAIRVVHALTETWSRHLEIERGLFPWMLCRDLYPAELLEQIAENNEAIMKQLSAILSAPWPRSAQAGLQSIRMGAAEVLIRLLTQVERERFTILPAMAAHSVSETTELMAT